jgi:hypothetical protein
VPEISPKRHLLYHLLPVAGNGRWQWNVGRLRVWLPLFDGLKLVAVMTDGERDYTRGSPAPDGARVPLELDAAEDVEAAFAGCPGVEFVRIPNDPNLREVVSHGPLFERLASAYAPGDVALWAHAKGTTRHPGHPAERWADMLYQAMLGYWPLVERTLQTKSLAGCFKKYGKGWDAKDSVSDWHYSGSWFWFRCADLFAKDWRRIDQFWSGIEPYPSQHFHHSEAGAVFFEGRVPQMNLYSARYWDRHVRPAWAKWQAKHRGDRCGPPEDSPC